MKYIDGIPLEMAALLLPFHCRFSLSLFSHIFVHAKLQQRYADSGNREKSPERKLSTGQLKSIARMLRNAIEDMKLKPVNRTEWGDYYGDTNYTPRAMEAKQLFIREMAVRIKPNKVLDIGGNDGTMIRLVAEKSESAVCCDIDPIAVERCYQQSKSGVGRNILPLLQDLTNPSPGLGFSSLERDSFISRCKADLVLALALIHHLAISNNLPLRYIAEFLAKLGKYCLVEFVPKEDSQVQRLLATREDIFPLYNVLEFEKVFGEYFFVIEKYKIPESKRALYFFGKK
jgi:ribosomal protein L11 methylase PrmA